MSPRWTVCVVLSSLLAPASALAAENEQLTFEKDIRPILRAHCFDCHGAVSELKGNLDLRLVRFQQRGGDSGPAIVPGKPDESYLLDRVRSGDMPPGDTKLSAAELQTLETWISQGANTARPEPESIAPGLGVTPEELAWWAFQPIKRPAVVEHAPEARTRTAVDSLLRTAMPAELSFAPDAEKQTLMLRAYLDLIGLPPTSAEADAFLQDASADAYERLVDRLLDSPHYGERWGRHWLDAAGYADSEGHATTDTVRDWAFKYRDYVIRAFNADKPFDRFIHEQLAGDEIAGPIQGDLTAEQTELYTATGYLTMAANGTGSGDDTPESRNQVVADTLKIVSTSLLGLSVACAQCHDHRYDPIPHTDYYAMRAVFEPALDWQKWLTPQQRHMSLSTAADRQLADDIEKEVQPIAVDRNAKEATYMKEAVEKELLRFDEALRDPLRTAYNTSADKRTPEQTALLDKYPSVNITPGVLYQYNPQATEELKKLDTKIAEIRAKKPVFQSIRVLTEPAGHLPETKLFYRGDYRQPKDTIAPAAMTVLSPNGTPHQFASDAENLPTSGRRLAFAQWLTGRENPITARVLVNRVWMHHFGRGLVETPADFGKLGALPTHPELLDWLADEFMANGWSLKKLHRVIMTSTAYRQASHATANADVERETRYYARKPVIRLEAESLRDRILATTGDLDRTQFGAPEAVMEDETGQVIVGANRRRRSVYVQQVRSRPVALLQAFDAPVMETNCERRPSSTAATQSLMLMNGNFVLEQAQKLAAKLFEAPAAAPVAQASGASATPTDWPNRIDTAWRNAYLRSPQPEEAKLATDFLTRQVDSLTREPRTLPEGVTPERQAFINLCQVLLTSNEFLYVE